MYRKFLLLILLLSYSNIVLAQEENAIPVLIKDINVTGIQTLKKESFLELLPFKVGDPYNKNKMVSSIQTLFKTGDFLDAAVSYKEDSDGNIIIMYSIKERPWISSIDFQGNASITNTNLKNKMESSEHSFLNINNLKKDIDSILQQYQVEGFVGTQVDTEQIYNTDNTIKLLFKISEGSKLSVSEINVYGTNILTPLYLKSNFMALKEPFFFNIVKYPLIPQAFDMEKQRMKELAYDHGFMDFQILQTKIIAKISYVPILKHMEEQLRHLGYGKAYINSYKTQFQYIFQHKDDKALEALVRDIKEIGLNTLKLKKQSDKEDLSLFLKDLEVETSSLLNIKKILIKNLPRDTNLDIQYVESNQFGYDINFYVEEGKPYIFTGVNILGSPRVQPDKLKKDFLILSPGDTYNYAIMESFKNNITQYFRDKGYFGVVIQDTPIKDPVRQTYAHKYIIQEGQKMHINKMYIQGNEKTKPYVVDRELRIKEGDVFNQSKIMTSQRLLQRTGYFKNIGIIPSPGPEENLLDLTWKLEEQRTGNLQLGGGYGTETGISVFGSIAENNFLGYGITASGKVSFGQYERGAQVSFSSNYLYYLPVGWSISTGYDWIRQQASPRYDRNHDNIWDKIVQKEDGKYYFIQKGDKDFASYYDENRTGSFDTSGIDINNAINFVPGKYDDLYSTQRYFDRQVLFLDLGAGYSFADFWSVNMVQSIMFSKYGNPHNIELNNILVDDYYSLKADLLSNKWSYSSHIDLGLTFNSTDSPLSPADGILTKYTMGFYGIEGGYDKFLKLEASFAGYLPIIDLPLADFKFVWASGIKLSYLHSLFGKIQLHYENQIGFNTMEEVRGWSSYIDDADLLGLSKISFGTELRASIPHTNSLLWLVGFFDGGNVSDIAEKLPIKLDEYLYSVGFGIRLDFPSFPVRFYLAQKLKWDKTFFKTQDGLTFQFSVSSAF